MSSISRRQFHATLAHGTAAAGLSLLSGQTLLTAQESSKNSAKISFCVVGDTHFLARKDSPADIDETSLRTNQNLVKTLNNLAGREISETAGGGKVQELSGLLHAGDIIDTGDKIGPTQSKMQETEWAHFQKVFGLNGKTGDLKLPVYEVHGNHDGPAGIGLALDGIKERNTKREGLKSRSANGMHYSWDWGGVHFVNLGITVGAGEKANPRRRYAPLDSLEFLRGDLEKEVGDSGRPVVLTHHIDIARYSGPCDMNAAGKPLATEWDSCDVQAYHAAISKYRIAGIFYGHTHVRNIYRWDGTPAKGETGIPVFNVDNSAHFSSDAQAFFYVEISPAETVIRELATTNRWETSDWTSQVWRVKLG